MAHFKMKKPVPINQRLLDIIHNDFDGCKWFIIASNELMKTIHNTIELFKDSNTSFKEMKNSIGEIGIGISSVEKSLEGVEECYNKLVESLSQEAKMNKGEGS